MKRELRTKLTFRLPYALFYSPATLPRKNRFVKPLWNHLRRFLIILWQAIHIDRVREEESLSFE